MWCKISLVFLLAITLAHSYVPEEAADELVSYEVDILGGVFDKLKALIENSIHSAQDTFKSLKETLKEEAAKSIEDLKNQLEGEVKKLVAEVESLEEKAKQDNIDIADCLKDRKETITNYPQNVSKEIAKFGEEKVNAGETLINDGSAEVLRASEKLDALTEEHTQCASMSFVKRTACYAKVNAKMTKDSVSIPMSLRKYKEKASKYVKHISTDLKAYGQDKIQRASSEGGALIKEIKKCIESKNKPEDVN